MPGCKQTAVMNFCPYTSDSHLSCNHMILDCWLIKLYKDALVARLGLEPHLSALWLVRDNCLENLYTQIIIVHIHRPI